MEYYSALKREILLFVTNLDESEGHYASWNKPEPERKKHCMSHLQMESK